MIMSAAAPYWVHPPFGVRSILFDILEGVALRRLILMKSDWMMLHCPMCVIESSILLCYCFVAQPVERGVLFSFR